MIILRYHGNEDQLIRNLSVTFHAKKGNEGFAVKLEKNTSEIAKIEKLVYRTISKYLYLKELRGEKIYKDMCNTLSEFFVCDRKKLYCKRYIFHVRLHLPFLLEGTSSIYLRKYRCSQIGPKQISEVLNI